MQGRAVVADETVYGLVVRLRIGGGRGKVGLLCRLLSNATSFMISSSDEAFRAFVPYGWNRWWVTQSQAYE